MYLTTKDVLKLLKISRVTLWRLKKRENNPFPKPAIVGGNGQGGFNRYKLEDIKNWEEK